MSPHNLSNPSKVFWVIRWQVNELLLTLLHTTKTPPSPTQIATVDKCIDYIREHSIDGDKELTPREKGISVGWDLLLPIIIHLTLGPKATHASKDLKKDIVVLLDFLKAAHRALETNNLDISAEGEVVFVHWTLFETCFLHLEFVKACHKLVETGTALAKQKGHPAFGKVPTDLLLQIRKEGKALADTVQKQAKNVRDGLVKEGRGKVGDVVRAGELGAVIEKLVGGEQLRRTVAEIAESAVEALDGVLKVKVA